MKKLWLTAALALASCAHVQAGAELEDKGWVRTALTEYTRAGLPIRWSPKNLPISVYVHPSAKIWLLHALKAAQIWNRWLGYEVFNVSPEYHIEALAFVDSAPGIVPIIGFEPDPLCASGRDDEECHPHTVVHYGRGGELIAAPIYMPKDFALALDPDCVWMLVHEYGHALGLDHDPQGREPWSIMEPRIRIPVEDPPKLTGKDLKMLLDWYIWLKEDDGGE